MFICHFGHSGPFLFWQLCSCGKFFVVFFLFLQIWWIMLIVFAIGPNIGGQFWVFGRINATGCMVSTGMIPRLGFASTRKVWTSSVVCTSAEVISTLAQVTLEPCSGGRPLRRRRLCQWFSILWVDFYPTSTRRATSGGKHYPGDTLVRSARRRIRRSERTPHRSEFFATRGTWTPLARGWLGTLVPRTWFRTRAVTPRTVQYEGYRIL